MSRMQVALTSPEGKVTVLSTRGMNAYGTPRTWRGRYCFDRKPEARIVSWVAQSVW
jgi:hypothetical protein